MRARDPGTMRGIFAAIDRYGDRLAVVCEGRTWTYREIGDAADRLAAWLVDQGVRPGDPVLLALANRAEWIIADQAIIRAGAAKVPVNDMLSATEIEYIIVDCGARVGLVDAALYKRVAGADAGDLTILLALDGVGANDSRVVSWPAALERTNADPPDILVRPDDRAMILYTGGTTGRQKGVVHTQRTLSICELAHVVELGLRDDERMLIISPLPHATGFLAQAGLLKGATLYIESKFDADLVLRRVSEDRITFVFMVPTMIYRVLDRADESPGDFSALRTILYGAAPITLETLSRGLRTFGPVFVQLYGQSESPDFITRLRREDHDLDHPERLSSCGQATALVEVAIFDDDDQPLPPGEVGQVVARGPFVMVGYHNLPEKSATTLADGWLHTGDVGRLDEQGYLFLLDRLNDMIISGGMNVYSTEVENVIQRCPGVGQVSVVGIADDDWGERVVAFVVAAGVDEPDLEGIRAVCREELAAYKRPKDVIVIGALPVTAFGKVDKKSLRARFGRREEHVTKLLT
jgi:fatty-acyl-CoA synthase